MQKKEKKCRKKNDSSSEIINLLSGNANKAMQCGRSRVVGTGGRSTPYQILTDQLTSEKGVAELR